MIAVVRNTGSANSAVLDERLAGAKASIISWLITAALLLSIGMVALGGLTAAAIAVAGSLSAAHDACQSTEANLASDLGISVTTLRGIDPATLANHIAARQNAGTLTATGALQATDHAGSYATCRQVFGQTTTTEPPSNR